jgi:hypothetical protein
LPVGAVDAPALVSCAADVGSSLLLFPLSLVGAAAVLEGAAASDVGSSVGFGSSEDVGSGVADATGGDDDAGASELGVAAADSVGAADAGVDTPVPSASCLLPWWMY